jgi:hypothetical protein
MYEQALLIFKASKSIRQESVFAISRAKMNQPSTLPRKIPSLLPLKTIVSRPSRIP